MASSVSPFSCPHLHRTASPPPASCKLGEAQTTYSFTPSLSSEGALLPSSLETGRWLNVHWRYCDKYDFFYIYFQRVSATELASATHTVSEDDEDFHFFRLSGSTNLSVLGIAHCSTRLPFHTKWTTRERINGKPPLELKPVYDQEADCVRLCFTTDRIRSCVQEEVAPNLVADYDQNRIVLAVEVIGACDKLPKL
ncbi:hypothetical protein CAOG_00581 [Capsaspora owczarzaki ATCC 30864]|nr:hypothetical protein CAOG_00581 [Capsaspora owczarzaki ATCC 30864]|eukprot:XP_004365452.1 hypothetical protein CAOG_00581 [Capsaspora owczarzaki ATCC 30864]